VEKMPEQARGDYLDAGWQFSVRLGTLVFERLARRRLTENGWSLLDFEQARSHRSDFLAYRNGKWRLLAVRVQPSKSKAVRKRLQRGGFPFDAIATLVVPDERPFTPDDDYASVPVLTLEELLSNSG